LICIAIVTNRRSPANRCAKPANHTLPHQLYLKSVDLFIRINDRTPAARSTAPTLNGLTDRIFNKHSHMQDFPTQRV
jgi:hypothetical protein